MAPRKVKTMLMQKAQKALKKALWYVVVFSVVVK